MAAAPAVVAGVKQLVLCTPPNEKGAIPDAVLFAAMVCGVGHIYKVGGAQAVFAMAYGTPTVPKCEIIAGPGNVYVTAAKQRVQDEVAIDFLAGPTELLVLSDGTTSAKFIAAELIGQAEHAPDTCCVLITTSEQQAKEVDAEMEIQAKQCERAEIIRKSMSTQGAPHRRRLVRPGDPVHQRVRRGAPHGVDAEADRDPQADQGGGLGVPRRILPGRGGRLRRRPQRDPSDLRRSAAPRQASRPTPSRGRSSTSCSPGGAAERRPDGDDPGPHREPPGPPALDRGAPWTLSLIRRSLAGLEPQVYPSTEQGVLLMDANTNLIGRNPAVDRAAKRLATLDLQQYPTCLSDDLRAAVAKEHGLSPEEVLVGNGSDEILDVICKTFCNPGDPIAIPVPTFVMYAFFARVHLASPVEAPLQWPSWQLDVDLILRVRPKIAVRRVAEQSDGKRLPEGRSGAPDRGIAGSRGRRRGLRRLLRPGLRVAGAAIRQPDRDAHVLQEATGWPGCAWATARATGS